MRMSTVLSGLVVATLAHAAAAQEPSFEALGQASVPGGDRVRARERALDEALRQAVEQATATLLEPGDLVARASELKLRIYPKARSYVTTYRVLDEGEQPPGTFQVHLSAQVATGRLARDLASGVNVAAPRPTMAHARAVVCAQATLRPGPHALPPLATGGAAPESDAAPAGAAPAKAGAERGATLDAEAVAREAEKGVREVLSARGVEPQPGPQPCSDASATETLRAGTAQGAVTATLEVAPAGEIRGTDLVAASARARLRVLDRDGRTSGDGDAERESYGAGLGRAAQAATRAAVSEAVRPLDGAMAARWPAPSAPAGGVAVRLSGADRYAAYQAVMRALAAIPGVALVEPRRFARGQIDLWLRTAAAPAQLAAQLQRAAAPAGLRLDVKAAGDALEINVAGEDAAERG